MKNHCDVTMKVVRANLDKLWAKRVQKLWFEDKLRLITIPDHHFTLDDLKGDVFNPKANPDIPAETLRLEERDFEAKVHRQGVFGLVVQIRNGDNWEEVDSTWGFIDEDFIGSGYDEELLKAALIALRPKKS